MRPDRLKRIRDRYRTDPKYRELMKKRAREYTARVPKAEQARRARERALKGYGISQEIYLAMLKKQGGGCAICLTKTRRFHVDHDHETNVVRGILCDACNKALGVFGDNLPGVLRVVEYLKRQPV